MYVNVSVDVSAEDVLAELDDVQLAEITAKRLNKVKEEHPRVLLEQVFYEFARRADAPICLREYLYQVLGRTLP